MRSPKWLANRSLRSKFLLLVLFLFGFCIVVLTSVANMTEKSYSKVIYQKTDQLLTVLAGNIEKELKQIEEFSFSIASDKTLQENLLILKDPAINEYNSSLALKRINAVLSSKKMWANNVIALAVHTDEYRISNGWNSSFVTETQFLRIKKKLETSKGRAQWEVLDSTASDVFLAKEILRISQLDLSQLGYLLVRINLAQAVRSGISSLEGVKNQTYLEIMSGEQLLYTSAAEFSQTVALAQTKEYSIVRSGKSTYLGACKNSQYNGWTYKIYTDISEETQSVRKYFLQTLIAGILVIALIAAICAAYLSSQTGHLENLVKKINNFYKNGIGLIYSDKRYEGRRDEIGVLHHSFDKMTSDIALHISRNYEQALLLKDAQIKLLQGQINPHFLFNTLNTINWLSKNNENEKVSECITALSRLLRNSLAVGDNLIPLREELALANDYLYLSKIRYGTRLIYQQQIEQAALNILVPKMCIQGLIENCIKHALGNMLEPCKIDITIKRDGAQILIFVADNGPGFSPEWSKTDAESTGIGLSNINSRIQLAYSAEYGVSIRSTDEGCTVIVKLPYE